MRKVLLLSGFLLVTFASVSRSDTINFDDVVAGTAVSSRYQGVTLSNALDGSDIFAMQVVNPANPTNGVSVFGLGENVFFGASIGDFNAQFGAVEATFDTPQGRVSIDVSGLLAPGNLLGNSPLHPFMEVYNGATLLAKLFYQEAPGGIEAGEVGAYETLLFTSATDNITRVRLSSQFDSTGSSGPNPFAEFDNLKFDARLASGQFPATGVTNPLRAAVPEPGLLSLLGAGGLGLALRKRRLLRK